MPAYSFNWTARTVLYKGDKDINVEARPPEVGPAEAGDLSTSNLPLISIPHIYIYVCVCVCACVCYL